MIEVKLENEKFQTLFKDLLKRVSDLTPLMRAISETMLYAVQRNFETEGRRLGGEGWVKHANKESKGHPSTEEQYKRQGKWPAKLLRQSGILFGSITPDYGSDFALVGSSMPPGKGYAAIQNFGGMAGRNRKVEIPARPFFKLIDEDFDDIEADGIKYLTLH